MTSKKTSGITLVVPDVHLRWRLVDALIAEVDPDRIIYLGDFFDQFHDSAAQNRMQAMWLKAEMKKSDRIFLWGNHDQHYAWPSKWTGCSGYEAGKDIAINEVMQPDDWAKFQWFTWLDGWLLTHAGLHPWFLPPNLLPKGEDMIDPYALDAWLKEECAYADVALRRGESHRFFRAGRCRGGLQNVGGLTWLDYNVEFKPINGLNQLVGHTNQLTTWKPLTLFGKQSTSHCIDTDSKYYAVSTNGEIKLKEIPESLMGLRNRLD
ncbi:MAG: hypothetical protein EBU46_10980 [Nitrosomonadaceae bacterium]|nr:hypothetical protein [Nitrosomonadaceae bacterium]